MDDLELIDELLELTVACHRGDATDGECARLERLLLDSPRAVDCYLQIVDDTLTLREAAAALADVPQPTLASAKIPAADGERDRTSDPFAWLAPLRMIRRRRVLGWAIAVCLPLLIAAGGWSVWSTRGAVATNVGQESAVTVRVVSVTNVRWSKGATPYKEWSFVEPGERLRIETGLVNLFLSNGVELLMEGPADAEFVSFDKVLAREGKFAARVGPGAVGFQIDTPHAQVIDRGTSFGLSVAGETRTDVVVYEGAVDLDVLGDRSQARRRLQTGEALSVDRRGQLSRITTVQSAEFLEPPQVRAAGARQNRVIAAVGDNLRSLETAKFHRVIPEGFYEDCRAYVDRLHEWNGLDEGGLPDFLLGGDYVMTFNDDKIATEIEISVAISQPATLYVLFDDRVPPPSWLTRDFVDTGYDVGSDEGWQDGVILTGVGPGQSVDRVCSVWRRDVLEPTTLVLGALGSEEFAVPAGEVDRSMYGIVAVPLNRGRMNQVHHNEVD